MIKDQKLEPAADDELSADELVRLFSALEDVCADDDLKSATIARMLEASGAAVDPADDERSVNDDVDASVVPETANGNAGISGTSKSTNGVATDGNSHIAIATAAHGADGKSRNTRKPWAQKIRVIRIIAIAACLTLALTGGAAYAIPSAHVQVSNSSSSIDVGINCFGIAVSAETNDEELGKLVDAASIGGPADEALDKAYSLLEEAAPDNPIAFSVDSGNPEQRQRLESKGREIVDQHHSQTSGDALSANASSLNAAPASDDVRSAAPSPEAPRTDGAGKEGDKENEPVDDEQKASDLRKNASQDNRYADSALESEASADRTPPQAEPDNGGSGGGAPEGPAPAQPPSGPGDDPRP